MRTALAAFIGAAAGAALGAKLSTLSAATGAAEKATSAFRTRPKGFMSSGVLEDAVEDTKANEEEPHA